MDKSIQDEFIATVSHELRTPLTSIRGFSQTLLTSWDKLDDNSKKRFISIIGEQSERLIHLVENILSVSKMNSNNTIMNEVNVNAAINKLMPIFNEQYKSHKIVLSLQNPLPTVRLDEDKFHQIMTNLVDNAAKYSSADSPIFISTLLCGESVRISVKDEGVGIKEKDFSKIFQKFSRLENHLTSKTQGNGLGLYITKQIVEKMNGSISFTSKEGRGTEFVVEFPLYNQEDVLRCSQQS